MFITKANRPWTRRRLLSAAEIRGLSVEANPRSGYTTIRGSHVIIKVQPDGTCLRGDVPVEWVKKLNYRQAAEQLGLTE